MRLRTELLLASALVALCFGMTWHAAQAQDDCPGSPDMKCGGSANCLGDTCITQPSEGRSCAMATAIDHKKCITGGPGDCCENTDVDCAELVYYGGGGCSGDPPQCNLQIPLNESETIQEQGCESFPGSP